MSDSEKQAEVFEHRASFRAGLAQVLIELPHADLRFFTGTYDLEKVRLKAAPSERWLILQAESLLSAVGAHGIIVAEHSRSGRLHSHGILVEPSSAAAFADRWSNLLGNTTLTPVTDVLGAIHYLTKAFTPETEYTWQFRSYSGSPPLSPNSPSETEAKSSERTASQELLEGPIEPDGDSVAAVDNPFGDQLVTHIGGNERNGKPRKKPKSGTRRLPLN